MDDTTSNPLTSKSLKKVKKPLQQSPSRLVPQIPRPEPALGEDGRSAKVQKPQPVNPGAPERAVTPPRTKFLYLPNIDRVLVKLFLNRSISKSDSFLKEHEKQIVSKILFKKKFPILAEEPLDWRSLNKLRQTKIKKKNEDELKFVLKKCIRHLQIRFLESVKHGDALDQASLKGVSLRDIKTNKDKYFYRFYFKDIAEREGIAIERFYHFRSWKNRFCKDIPKSITRQSLDLWKKNTDFIRQIKEYISQSLVGHFFEFNSKKIHTMVSKWERIIDEHGQRKGLRQILDSFDVKGSKLPWTLSEVETAIVHTLKCLC